MKIEGRAGGENGGGMEGEREGMRGESEGG